MKLLKFSSRFVIALWWCTLLLAQESLAQHFRFGKNLLSERVAAPVMKYINTNPGTDIDTTILLHHDKWNEMIVPGSTWAQYYKFKSLHTIVELGVDHAYLPVHQQPYAIRIAYTVNGYSNPQAPGTISQVIYDTLTIAYRPDSLAQYQDKQLKKYYGFHKVEVVVNTLFDVSDPLQPPVPVVFNRTGSYDNLNFYFQVAMDVQVYHKRGRDNAGNAVNIYGIGGAEMKVTRGTAQNDYLPVSWNYNNKSTINDLMPAKFELEWTYVDNYAVDPRLGSSSDPDISKKTITSLNYDFSNNATRVVLDTNAYKIPLVYNQGYLLYRVRMVKPDSVNYELPVYGPWSVAASGTLSNNLITNHGYEITAAHQDDKLNWQYTISFAEQGKYKHVLSYYDGLLKNRQSVTRFNATPGRLIAVEQVYDYEGRPSISILPTPVQSPAFTYQQGLSLNSLTGRPYAPGDFDFIPGSCGEDVLIPALHDSALAQQYYSSGNPDQSGFNAYIPDAGGYPLLQTVYSPGYSDRVDKQGGAGDSLQIGFRHYQKNIYTGAEQSTLNKVFGLNIGNAGFYRKHVSRDPNGQYSVNYADYKGNTVFTSLVGIPDTSALALTKNEGANETSGFREDLIRGTRQQRLGSRIYLERVFFNEEDGNKDIRYKVTFRPYPTFCTGVFLNADILYNYRMISDCGATAAADSGTLGSAGMSFSGTPLTDSSLRNFFMEQDKYIVRKDLTVNMASVYAAVDSFMVSGYVDSAGCLKNEDWFIKQAVLEKEFPCEEAFNCEPDCESRRRQMLAELWPNIDSMYQERRYGSFSMDDFFGSVGGWNSIFRVQNRETQEYYSRFELENMRFSEGFLYLDSLIVTAGDTIWLRRPYQDDCIRFPDSVVKNGRVYRDIRNLPVDTFIYIFNDEIAAALLPLHPEYCQLLSCYDDPYPMFLHELRNGTNALEAGYLKLEDIITRDTIYTLMLQRPLEFPSPLDTLRYFNAGNGRLISIDTVAMQLAYCSNADSIIYATCLAETFTKAIEDYVYSTPYVRDLYFEKARALYLGNRERFKYLLTDTSICNDTCRAGGILAMEPPIFPNTGSTWFTNTLARLDSNAYQRFLNFYDYVDTNNLARSYDSAMDIYYRGLQELADGHIRGIVRDLSNCADSTVMARVKDTLGAMFSSGRIYNGMFSAENITYALEVNGISLDELCNPYLASNERFFSTEGNNGRFSCNSALFYNGAYESFGTKLQAVIANTSPSSPLTVSWSGTNVFDQAIAGVVQGSSSPVYTRRSADRIRLDITGADTVAFYISRVIPYTSDPVFDLGTYTVESVECINDAFGGLYAQKFKGYIGMQVFMLTVSDAGERYHYFVWSDKIAVNASADDNKLKDAVSCVTYRKHFNSFLEMLSGLDIHVADGPNFKRMLTSFMNYRMGNAYADFDYENFIASCAIADSAELLQQHNYVRLSFPSAGAYTTFVNGFNAVDPEYIYEPYLNIRQGSSYVSYFDIRYIDRHLYRRYTDYITAQAPAYDFNAPLVPYAAARVGYLYLQQPLDPDTILPVALQNKFTLQPEGSEEISRNHIAYTTFDKYDLQAVNGSVTLEEKNRAAVWLRQYLRDAGLEHHWFPLRKEYDDPQHDHPLKKAYLAYTYGMPHLSATAVLDSVQEAVIRQEVPGFGSLDLGYGYAQRPDLVSHLYYKPDTPVSHAMLDNILTKVRTFLGSNTIFFGPQTISIINTATERLDGFRMSDGMYWFRYFDSHNKLYNVYIRPPRYMKPGQLMDYKYLSHTIHTGSEDVTSFTLAVRDSIASPVRNAQFTCYTDFRLAQSEALYDVLLAGPLSRKVRVADTGNNCERFRLNEAVWEGRLRYKRYVDSVRNFLVTDMKDFLVNRGGLTEQLELSYASHQFNYTLYHYDRVGNLVATVPPAGVHSLVTDSLSVVNDVRDSNLFRATLLPGHEKVSVYQYNTLNQVSEQQTPDGGRTLFFYDKAGRLVFSQNAEQRTSGKLSYTIYDDLGRIVETGQIKAACTPYFEPYPKANGINPNQCGYADDIRNQYTPFPPLVTQLLVTDYAATRNAIRAYPREEVVLTQYDEAVKDLSAEPGFSRQDNLRNRVAAVLYFDHLNQGGSLLSYNYGMHYSYDIAGNVKTLTRDYPALRMLHQDLKRVDYDYDMISGKVNMLSYNRSFGDQFFQKYTYDDDNRITAVSTSNDGMFWDEDARYDYYAHGPLARMSLGEHRVQGVDYIYTIQGWLKALNGDLVDTANDPGRDYFFNNAHARDIAGVTLDYFAGDYTPIAGQDANTAGKLRKVSRNMYNGNIPRMQTNLAPFDPLSAHYTYDQLNRLVKAEYDYYRNDDTTLLATEDYYTRYAYDADGNIRSLVRNGNLPGTQRMDSIVYHYAANGPNSSSNQLLNISDYAADNYTNDIKYYVNSNNSSRYTYDKLGNLTKDEVNGWDAIRWNLQNKVAHTYDGANNRGLEFAYDGMGQRYRKSSIRYFQDSSAAKNSYYVRDAQGNILAVYDYYMHHSVAYEQVIRRIFQHYTTVVGPASPPKLFFRELALPLNAGYAAFNNTYVAALQDTYADMGNQLLDTMPVSYFTGRSSDVKDNLLYNASGDVSFYQQLFDYARDESVPVFSRAMTYYTRDHDGSIPTLLNGIAIEGEDYARYLAGYTWGADSITRPLLLDLGIDTTEVDNFLSNTQYDRDQYREELVGLVDPSVIIHFMTRFLDAAIFYEFTTGDYLTGYWEHLESDENFVSVFMPYLSENGAMAPVFRSALQYYAPDDTLGAFLDYYPQMRDLLRSTNSADNLLHLLLEDTAFSIDNIYALQYDAYGDDLVVAASVAAQAGNNMATLTSSVLNLGSGYLTIIDTIEKMVVGEQEMQLSEHHLYGSSRLGIKNYLPRQVYAYWNNTDIIPVADTGSLLSRRPWYSLEYNDVINGLALSPYGSTDQTTSGSQHLAGQRQYEMTNHLGNVLATLSDLPYKSEGEVLQFRVNPALRAVYDYYPFGSLKPGRYVSDTTENCVTMTQSRWVVKYRDSTVWNPIGSGGWVSAPATTPNLGIAQQITLSSIPGDGISIEIADTAPVGGLMTAVQELSVTPNVRQDLELNLQVVSGTFVLRLLEEVNGTDVLLGSLTVSNADGSDGTVSAPASYSISILPSTSNVRLQVSSPITMGTVLCCAPRVMNGYWKKITVPYLEQENIVVTLCDSTGDKYRFGFNGQEKVNEWGGIGNFNEFNYRIHDARLGRFLSQDPLHSEFPWNSTYAFAENDVLRCIDLEGLEKVIITENYPPYAPYVRTAILNRNKEQWKAGKYGYVDHRTNKMTITDNPKLKRDEAWFNDLAGPKNIELYEKTGDGAKLSIYKKNRFTEPIKVPSKVGETAVTNVRIPFREGTNYFEEDDDNIEIDNLLTPLAGLMKADPSLKAKITGESPIKKDQAIDAIAIGNSAADAKILFQETGGYLMGKRAEKIKSMLVDKGVNSDNISIQPGEGGNSSFSATIEIKKYEFKK